MAMSVPAHEESVRRVNLTPHTRARCARMTSRGGAVARTHMTIEDEFGRVVCERCVLADGALTRLRGLLGRRELPRGEGLLLRPSPSIHTLFMRFPIDAVFLNRDLHVLSVRPALPAWRMAGAGGGRGGGAGARAAARGAVGGGAVGAGSSPGGTTPSARVPPWALAGGAALA